jgi:hypothetical protein
MTPSGAGAGRHLWADTHHGLLLRAQPKLGNIEQPVDDIETAGHAVVDELGFAAVADHEQRRRLADADARRELDERLSPVVESAQWPPGRPVAGHRITEVELLDGEPRRDRPCRFRRCLLAADRDQLVLGIGPGQGGHRGGRRAF